MAIKDFVVKIVVNAQDKASKVFTDLNKAAHDAFSTISKLFDSFSNSNSITSFIDKLNQVKSSLQSFIVEIEAAANFSAFSKGITSAANAFDKLLNSFSKVTAVNVLATNIKNLLTSIAASSPQFKNLASDISKASQKFTESTASFKLFIAEVRKLREFGNFSKGIATISTALERLMKSFLQIRAIDILATNRQRDERSGGG